MARSYNRRRGLLLGTDLENGESISLRAEWLDTAVHILGRTKSGKTRLALSFFEQFAHDSEATTIVLSPKGDLGAMARDYAIEHGLGKRLVVFDPAETDRVIGYNPLRPNGGDPYLQARLVREAVLAAHGQQGLEKTQQLARCLNIALTAARLLELTFIEACELLRPESAMRRAVLDRLTDPVLAGALGYLDKLRPQRQDELASSALARLEAFITVPTIRRIISQQTHALDLDAILRERKILIVNLEYYRPLAPADVKMLGRLVVNDVIAHAFARGRAERTPVRLIIDEVECFATEALTVALDMGRELGLQAILAHQHLEQLVLEDESRKLLASVLNNTVVKIVSGSTSVDDLRRLADQLFLDSWDPKAIKDERTSLECEPRWEWHSSNTVGSNWSDTDSCGTTQTHTRSRSSTEAYGESFGQVESTAELAGTQSGEIESLDADGNPMTSRTSGVSSASVAGHADIHSETYLSGTSRGKAWSTGHIRQHASQDGGSESITVSPMIGYAKRRIVSTRTFWTYEEHVLRSIQRAQRQRTGEFLVKVPGTPVRTFRAPRVRTPYVSAQQLTQATARMHALPYYGQPADIAEEERTRLAALTSAAPDSTPHGSAIVAARTHKPRSLPRSNKAWDFGIPKK